MLDKYKDYLDLISEHPDYTCKQLSDRLEISELELQDYADKLKGDDSAWRYILRTTHYPEFIDTFFSIVDRDREWLNSCIAEEFVFPKILEIHPGPTCTHNCKHCFSRGNEYDENDDLMTLDDLKYVLTVCGGEGTEEVWISGGKEPFTASYTHELINLAADMGFRVRLYTNGLLMQGERLRAALRCYQVRVSLNAINEKTYAEVNGTPSHDVVMRNFEKLLSERLAGNLDTNVIACMIVQPDNHKEVYEFAEKMICMGANRVQLRSDSVGRTGRLLTFEIERILEQISRVKKEYGKIVDIRGLEKEDFSSGSQFYPGLGCPQTCYAGAYKRSINPFGDVYYCDFSSHPVFSKERINLCIGNIKEDNIREVFSRAFHEVVPTCELCQQHGYGLNLQIHKLKEDLDYGISIDKQPFNRTKNEGG